MLLSSLKNAGIRVCQFQTTLLERRLYLIAFTTKWQQFFLSFFMSDERVMAAGVLPKFCIASNPTQLFHCSQVCLQLQVAAAMKHMRETQSLFQSPMCEFDFVCWWVELWKTYTQMCSHKRIHLQWWQKLKQQEQLILILMFTTLISPE